ncbi:S-adenosyl-L-methionine-dependent methyltransferase [Rhizopus microsporus var. microsporus]|uniref:S-adenosyl-L-methionine-dependent methyltransferase n=2 Tax=Rhizopus microsporus TaxID=58291 RepID=A0A2G4SRZ9_RHIZD|nr:S-adenosyl-L-methionine-dependent methyltransferase [Rhizopus microsporus ATCC 52813]ORE01241.1 S-adenosyl-L-methionine-dependent methyltransferase [Rhizopus microsporus var. microsporus]PHZ11525.1 S-adenosyl-L-methionine-dependent methyltransferase [Rhizopus microsporus ATCC 52813]
MITQKAITAAVDPTFFDTKQEFHNDETSGYWLPKDEEEQKRLTAQHFAIKSLYGGNVMPSVAEALDLEGGITILDVGCSSGTWIMDIVQEHPNCIYHGCDIVDVTYKNIDVKQFTFSLGNVTNRLPYEDNTFDFVHMRLFVACLRKDEWTTALSEVIRVTKPGGMIQLGEFDLQPQNDSSSLYYRILSCFKDACKSRGQDPNIGSELEIMLSKYSNVKVVESDHRACDMSSGTPTAKMFIWDNLEAIKSMRRVLGPMLGIHNQKDLVSFLKEYKHDLETKESVVGFAVVTAQKL